jgi:hypothetical protein
MKVEVRTSVKFLGKALRVQILKYVLFISIPVNLPENMACNNDIFYIYFRFNFSRRWIFGSFVDKYQSTKIYGFTSQKNLVEFIKLYTCVGQSEEQCVEWEELISVSVTDSGASLLMSGKGNDPPLLTNTSRDSLYEYLCCRNNFRFPLYYRIEASKLEQYLAK